MSTELLPPAQPSFVLRGHSAQVHVVRFIQGNTRLLSADADGWLVSWNIASKRPAAVWRAHSNAVLGIGSWGQDRIITCVMHLDRCTLLSADGMGNLVMAEIASWPYGSSMSKTKKQSERRSQSTNPQPLHPNHGYSTYSPSTLSTSVRLQCVSMVCLNPMPFMPPSKPGNIHHQS